VTVTATPAPTVTGEAEPLPIEEDEGSSLMWLPVAGIVLLAAGALLYVTRRS
jgi:LPXTG-motif cell wall-anchored protein